MSINIRFTDADWQRIERDWNAWWAGELERPLIFLESVDPVPEADWSQFSKFGLDTPADVIIDNWQRIFEATHFLGDAFPKWWVNYGPGVMAAFLGSRVTWTPDTTWFSPLEGVQSLADIHPVYDPNNPWWLRVQEVTRRAVERWGDQVLVGITDIGGNLDILASLRGSEKLLLDLTDDPENVDRRIQPKLAELRPVRPRHRVDRFQENQRAIQFARPPRVPIALNPLPVGIRKPDVDGHGYSLG